jgi:hypothetical protein
MHGPRFAVVGAHLTACVDFLSWCNHQCDIVTVIKMEQQSGNNNDNHDYMWIIMTICDTVNALVVVARAFDHSRGLHIQI